MESSKTSNSKRSQERKKKAKQKISNKTLWRDKFKKETISLDIWNHNIHYFIVPSSTYKKEELCTTLDMLKTTELYPLKQWVLWYMEHISIEPAALCSGIPGWAAAVRSSRRSPRLQSHRASPLTAFCLLPGSCPSALWVLSLPESYPSPLLSLTFLSSLHALTLVRGSFLINDLSKTRQPLNYWLQTDSEVLLGLLLLFLPAPDSTACSCFPSSLP